MAQHNLLIVPIGLIFGQYSVPKARIFLSVQFRPIATKTPETAVSLEYISKAVQLAAPEGYARLFLEGERPLLSLLPAIRIVSPDWVDTILAMADMPADSRVPLLAELPEPLSEQESNVLRLLCTGHPIGKLPTAPLSAPARPNGTS